MNMGIGIHPNGLLSGLGPRLAVILDVGSFGGVLEWIRANTLPQNLLHHNRPLSTTGSLPASHLWILGEWSEEDRAAIVGKLCQINCVPMPESVSDLSLFLPQLNGWVGEAGSDGIWGILGGACARMGLKVIHGDG